MEMLQNITSLQWRDVSIEIKIKNGTKKLLNEVSGSISGGKLMALMGPSGSGKTTLLNFLAGRSYSKTKNDGKLYYCDSEISSKSLQRISRFIEQEDKLIGSLTVFETVDFAAKLAGYEKNATSRKERVKDVIHQLGLSNQENVIVGTPLKKGLSGGQKRRLSIACELVTSPTILFLDEPTSGLDSRASYEVISALKNIARVDNLIVIASIHQPSSSTFNLFDEVTFLTGGRSVYSGPRGEIQNYFEDQGFTFDLHVNLSEFVIDLINTDFYENEHSLRVVEDLVANWASSALNEKLDLSSAGADKIFEPNMAIRNCKPCYQVVVMLHRSLLKSFRDFLAYYVRIVMYLALAIMMGTVWLRLGKGQEYIQPYINAIFFSGAFMSFMSVAYIPAYLEDFQCYRKEKLNGLYGPLPFVVSNFLVSIPFLFLTTLLFSLVTYFLVNFRKTADGFWYYVMWLFLDLLAAESLTVLITSIFPYFVIALALTAFANGLWMSVGGFLVSQKILNVFWYYTFYWINYQRYVFQGMMFNQFEHAIYDCGAGCQCMYVSPLQEQCKIAGSAILDNLGYLSNERGLWIGLILVIVLVMRFGTYIVLKLKQ